jgi:Na+/H+ antiporter NhaD/arsenite permease-like protein
LRQEEDRVRAGLAFAIVLLIARSAGAETGGLETHLGESLPLWSALPFAGLLLSIAFIPLLAPHFWHHRYPVIASGWGVLFAAPFLVLYRGEGLQALLHSLVIEYIPFIILLGALFTISGGIVLRGTLRGTPRANTALLAVGTILASWIGTTGASMLLIRPLLRANAGRSRRAHIVVFFIFLVSNLGGSLTPLGDPPLFLGFLSGVPFFWTLKLLPHSGLAAAMLLAAFYVLDRLAFRREGIAARDHTGPSEPLRVAGWTNVALLAAVVLAVLLSGIVHLPEVALWGVHRRGADIARDVVLVILGLVSLRYGPTHLRGENRFGWEPMREVAILFAAIFVTIVPALTILAAGEKGALAPLVRSAVDPWHYFWITGGLSSFLDNAPTYLTFLATALGRFFQGVPQRQAVTMLVHQQPLILEAISAGAVYMGAMTYIGNAPNFMVRSLAEEAGVAMPSFFGYLFRWSIPFLAPALVIVTLLFFY